MLGVPPVTVPRLESGLCSGVRRRRYVDQLAAPTPTFHRPAFADTRSAGLSMSLAGMIPAFATAGALIYVAMLMMGGMAHIDWDEHTETIPAIVTVIMMPLTFSVADGIALGFITYVAMKVLTGKHRFAGQLPMPCL